MQIKPINLNIQYNRLQEVFDFRFYGGEGGLGSFLNNVLLRILLKINNLMQRVEKINNSLPQIYPNLRSNRPLYGIIKLDPKYIENMFFLFKSQPPPSQIELSSPYEIQ